MRYSEKEAFNNCPYKYKLQKEGLTKQTEGSDAHDKNWGAAIHNSLMLHYKGMDWNKVEAGFKELYPVSLVEDDLAKTVESGIGCLKRYIEHYRGQDQNWEVLSAEEEGSVQIGGEDHDLHIDLVARNKQSGDIYLWDHKTTSKPASPTYWKGFELSGQLTRYCVFVKEKYGNCAGAIINNISVKHLKIKNKYGEGPGLVCSFERQLFNRTPQQVAFWRESDEMWMKQIEFSKRENCWPRALNKLCAWCEYYELCLASADPQIKELMYEIKMKVTVEK